MTNSASARLRQHNTRIMSEWEARANNEVMAALHQKSLALRDSLPEYLNQLADALSKTIDRTGARKRWDRSESERIGKKHGHERASMAHYTMEQLIFEYHILRQVLCDVLEEEAPLSALEHEIIICSVEQAVNDAATQFSETLRDMQETLTNTLAHDLRGPITVAKASAFQITKHSDNPEQCAKSAARIDKSMDRLDSMICDLLDASKIRAGEKLELQTEKIDLELVAKQVIDEANLTQENRIVMESSGPTIGFWSENGLRRVLENLLTNALKYGSPSTPITLKLTQNADNATLSVHNFGKAISESEQAVLFQPFRRLRSAESKPGWGLGLTVVEGVAQAHGGTVTVESK
ncbi:MAG: sensor histidine kinase, partial [Bdellovibrionota bacterium]